jgi:glycosyltransferase involved in cell wall biosynthesis
VTVVVPVWNAEPTLLGTLESAAMQLEIVIVSGGSNNASPSIAAACCEKEPRARLISKPNGGAASARNHGMEHARGKWIAPLDADDLWHPTKIAKQVTAALNAPSGPVSYRILLASAHR